MTKFDDLLHAQERAGEKVAAYIEGCRSFAFTFATGLRDYLQCPPMTLGWLLDPDQIPLPLDLLRNNLEPKEKGEWELDLTIFFGQMKGRYPIHLSFRKKGNEFLLTCLPKGKTFSIPETVTAAQLFPEYEYICKQVQDFLNNIIDHLFSDAEAARAPVGFVLPGKIE